MIADTLPLPEHPGSYDPAPADKLGSHSFAGVQSQVAP